MNTPPESLATMEAAKFALWAYDGRRPELWDLSFERSAETTDTPIGQALQKMRQCWGRDRTYADRRRLRAAAQAVRSALDAAYPPHSWHWTTTVSVAVVSAVTLFVLYRIST